MAGRTAVLVCAEDGCPHPPERTAPPGLGGAYGLLSDADQQLYEAKAAGRDCVRPMTLASVEIAQS